MTSSSRWLLALALGLAAASSQAESLASSASSAASQSVGSLSESLKTSSNSSNERKVAEGDYRVIDVAVLADKPGMVRLTMQAAHGDGGEIMLDLPLKALEPQNIAKGDVVSARERAYGYEFARAATREPFFLVLADDWKSDIAPRPVGL